MRAPLLVVLLVLGGCASTGTPEGVFDTYMEAYQDGDAPRMWSLSSPTVHSETQELRQRFLTLLRDPDAAKRVAVEGTFGITADTMEPMDGKTFFIWAVHTIRRQLGASTIRQIVATMRRLRIESQGPDNVYIVYRGDRGQEHRMHVRRWNDRWLVEDNPFFPKNTTGEDTPEQDKEPVSEDG